MGMLAACGGKTRVDAAPERFDLRVEGVVSDFAGFEIHAVVETDQRFDDRLTVPDDGRVSFEWFDAVAAEPLLIWVFVDRDMDGVCTLLPESPLQSDPGWTHTQPAVSADLTLSLAEFGGMDWCGFDADP
jgi:hypothetical protein